MTVRSLTLSHDGLQFSAYEKGNGPLVLLLHGFPDHPLTFEHQIGALSKAGFRVVAPFLRGYETRSVPPDRDVSVERVVEDIVAWADQSRAEKFHLIGHDWGAIAAYLVGARLPDRLLSLTAMAVPHPPGFRRALLKVPSQNLKSWYINFFQFRGLSDYVVKRRNFSLIRALWQNWSPGYSMSPAHWRRLETMFGEEGVLTSTLDYYRRNVSLLRLLGLRPTPMMREKRVGVPTLVITGAQDGCLDTRLFDHCFDEENFPAGLTIKRIDDAGHFLHLEKPEEINETLITWLKTHSDVSPPEAIELVD